MEHQNETPEPEYRPVEEIDPRAVMEALRDSQPPVLLDVREPYEWRQVRIPGKVLYISMNEVPYRLSELDPKAEIVVICAHGHRSYSVAEYLLENGYRARSLKGGIFGWYAQHGEVETG